MKYLAILAATILLLSPTAFAAGPLGFGLQATGANVNFEGPTKEMYGFGFGGGLHLDVNFIPMLSLRLQGDYVLFSPDKGKYAAYLARGAGRSPSDLSVEGGRLTFISAIANVKFDVLPAPLVSPYVTGGVGITSFSYSDLTVNYRGQVIPLNISKPESQTKFSANLGAGIDVNVAVVNVYLEARYSWIFTKGSTSTYIPVSLGVTL
ncbi:MAG: hypothetical protein C4326_01680 [Ignavibacteria bacterium]